MLAASRALTPFNDSGKATAGSNGAVISSTKLSVAAGLVLPAASVMVVLVVQVPSTLNALVGISWLMVNGPLPVKLPPCVVGKSLACTV